MTSLRVFFARLFSRLREKQWELELDDEVGFHIEMEVERNVARGLSPKEARRLALRQFGGRELTKEAYRDQKGLPLVETLIQDTRYGIRMLLKHRSFTAVAVLTLALGIGANTAIFSVVNGVLLKPLPYDGSERIVMVWEDFTARGGPAQEWIEVPNLYEWRAQNDAFETISAFGIGSANLTSGQDAQMLSRGGVTYEFFTTFGLEPVLGRNFAERDDRPDSDPVTILSYEVWQRLFGGNRSILGSSIELSGTPTTVVGILPPGFSIPQNPPIDLWTPLGLDPARASRGNFFLQGVGRIKEGVSLERAQARMDVIMKRIGREHEIDRDVKVLLVPLLEQVVSPVKAGLYVLLAIVLFVLMIACANIANLMLSRGASRSREMAIRSALGAGSARLARQLLTESLLLSLIGAGFGVLLARGGIAALIALAPAGAPRLDSIQLDGTVLLFSLALSVLAGLTFGMAPAVQSYRQHVGATLKDGGRGTHSPAGGTRLRSALAAGQVTLALLLLIASGLMIRSFVTLTDVDPGFKADGLTTAFISMPSSSYAGSAELANFLPALLEQTAGRSGVDAVAAVSVLPLGGVDSDTGFDIEGKPEMPPGQRPTVWYRRVTPSYFSTMSIRVLRGREFSDSDHSKALPVVMISDVTARRYWPDEDALGKRVRFGSGPWHTIVGIVQGTRHNGLNAQPRPELYFPYVQRPGRNMTLIVKSSAGSGAVGDMLRADLKQLNPQLPLSTVVALSELVDRSVAQPRFFMSLTAGFGALALALAAVGIYGVMSYRVSRLTPEVGLRMALGANRARVLSMILRQGLGLTLVGTIAGLILAFWATDLMASLLFTIGPRDPLAFAGAPLVLALISLVACLIPALRATRIDPISALRAD